MNDKDLIYSFDLGSGSLGICVRQGKEVKYIDSLLIDKDFASIKESANRRRQIKTRMAHKQREKWWKEEAKKAGLEVLSTEQPTKNNPKAKPDERMLRQFPKDGDNTIYSSTLLRIALLQGQKLESWQIFKAIWSAMQRRGYDKIPWGFDSDKEENIVAVNEYDKKLEEFFGSQKEYYYPCYYEAFKQGIWSPKEPYNLSGKLSSNPLPARNKDKQTLATPSRELVSNELKNLLQRASKQFPKLIGKEDFIIYGPAQKPYASYDKNGEYTKFRGKDWDWQGLLGQKIPRFDNRIISKCKLISRFNVCKANKTLNKEVTFLLALKNMRFTKDDKTSVSLNSEQIKYLFDLYKSNFNSKENKTQKALINSKTWKKYIKEELHGIPNPNQTEIPQPKLGGRSSFCKPALNILHSLLLSGKNPNDYYNELVKNIKNINPVKGLIKEDFKFLLNMPNDWNSISVQDTREELKKLSKEESHKQIQKVISGIQNRIVRHRLLILLLQFEKLNEKYGQPDKIIFEIAREDFVGKDREKEYVSLQNANKKEIESAIKKLQDAGIKINQKNILRARLFLQQDGKDVYDISENRNLSFQNLEQYEIDHIVPTTRGGSDSFSNFVLTKLQNNQNKENLTPYEWFYKKNSDKWNEYIKNVESIKNLGKHKTELLISDAAIELESKRTDLHATSQIEKLAQQIASLYFGFGLNTKDDKRRIIFFTGGNTSDVRKGLDLNRILFPNLSDDEYKELKKQKNFKDKNRSNARHHALDALVLNFLPEIKMDKKSIIQKPYFFDKVFCENALSLVYPKTIKTVTPKLRETVYSLKCRIENGIKKYYFISKFNSSIDNFKDLEPKKKGADSAKTNVKKVFSFQIKKDFENIMQNENLKQEEWSKFLEQYTDNYKKIKKISIIDSKAFSSEDVFDNNGNFKKNIGEYKQNEGTPNQWIKGKEGHQGQIVFKNDKNKWQVVPVYAFDSLYKKLKEYQKKFNDVRFFSSGQLIRLIKKHEYFRKKEKFTIEIGIYKLTTIKTNGQTKIINLSTQKEEIQQINIFIEECGMVSYENK